MRIRPYAWYALFVMTAAFVLAFIDRQLLNLLVEPIKRELRVSDFQISLLQGFVFALFLSLAGLPIGGLVDRSRRTRLLALGAAVWSLATAACGLARIYPQLMLARMGVGLGEASVTPSALSLIGDYFPPRRMGLATGLYALGVHVGSGLALLLGGVAVAEASRVQLALPVVGALSGWRLVFAALGAPGLLVALWVATLKEPERGFYLGGAGEAPSGAETRAFLSATGWALTCANLSVGFALMSVYGVSAWLPSFMVRHFGWTTGEFGKVYGPVVIVTGVVGVLGAGVTGDVLVGRGTADGRVRVMVAASLLAAPLAVFAPLAASPALALTAFGLANLFAAAAVGSGPALLQEMTPPRMRGVTHALAVLTVNLIALGLGPTAIAAVTDFVLGDERRVGVAIAAVSPTLLLIASGFALLGRRPFLRARLPV